MNEETRGHTGLSKLLGNSTMTAADASENGTARTKRALSSIRGSSGLVPINVFKHKQSEIRNLVSTCIEETSPSNKLAAVKELNHIHQEFETQTSELQKCLNFYDHQLLMYLGTPFGSETSAKKELQTFEEIRVRRQMHENDDYVNFVCKQAVDNSMNKEEKHLIESMLINNQRNINRQLWKPNRLYLNSVVEEEIEKFIASN